MAHDHLAPDVGDVGRAAVHQVRRSARAEPMPVAGGVSGKARTMIERGKDRRRVRAWFSSLMHERRCGFDRRACTVPLTWPADALPGAIRPGVGEAAPARERRRVPESGME